MKKEWEPHPRLSRDPGTVRVRVGSYELEKKGASRFDVHDPYHLAVALTWPQFLVIVLAIYLLVNVAFATLYWLVPGCLAHARPHEFGDAYFFSIETLTTVGYGEMYPNTLYGHVVSAIEIVCGVGFTAIVTGLTFVRFSRPRAKLIFASNPVVAMHEGKPTLMVRIGNGRLGVLLDAAAKLNLAISAPSSDGRRFRRARELRLERSHLPAFPLTWTLMHVLDERSPLHGYDSARAIAMGAQLFVTVQALDPTLGASVHDIRNYAPEDIRFGMRYADAVTITEDGRPGADLGRIGALEPDVGDHLESGWTEREEPQE